MSDPTCAYCDRTNGLRVLHAVPEDDYVCEDCFTPTDTGPCFDDLSTVEQRNIDA